MAPRSVRTWPAEACWLYVALRTAGVSANEQAAPLLEFQCPSETEGCPCTVGCLEEIGNDTCTCRNVTHLSPCVSNMSETFCPQTPCDIEACSVCADSSANECAECMDGALKLDGQCLSFSTAFLETAVRVKRNLVLVGDNRSLAMLEACFDGSGDCYEAIEYAARAFLHSFEDVFDGILVFPWISLPGNPPVSHYWSGAPLREAGGRLSSLLTLQNVGPSEGAALPSLLHEICQRWSASCLDFIEEQRDIPGSWGLTVLDRGGALGGFPPSSVRCEHGTFPHCDSNRAFWNFDQSGFDNANATMLGRGTLSKFELLLMGLQPPEELEELAPLVHCQGPSQINGTGETPVTCTSMVVLNATGVAESMSAAARAEQIYPGYHLRMVALVVFPSAADVELEAIRSSWTPGSDLEWLSNWVSSSAALFGNATEGLADLSFEVTDDERRQANASDWEEASTTGPSDWMADVPAPDANMVQVLMTIQNVNFERLATNATLFNDFSHAVVVAIANTGGVSETSVSLTLASGSVRVTAAILTESRKSATGVAEQLTAPTSQLDRVVVVAVEDVLEGVSEVSLGSISVTGLTVVTSRADEDKDTSSAGSLQTPVMQWVLLHLAICGVCRLRGHP